MADKWTVTDINTNYDAISEANLTLPLAEEIDFETKWKTLELIRRELLEITTSEGADDGQSISELVTTLTALIDACKVYDQAGFYMGQPAAGLKVFSIAVVRSFTLPANCTGSVGKVGTVPHVTSTFTIKKNGSSIGTMTFPANVASATFTSTATSFVSGDILEVYAPATQDDDLEDVSFTFKISYT